MGDPVPTDVGHVIYIDEQDGEVSCYILGKYGVWYPVALGERPYRSSRAVDVIPWTG